MIRQTCAEVDGSEISVMSIFYDIIAFIHQIHADMHFTFIYELCPVDKLTDCIKIYELIDALKLLKIQHRQDRIVHFWSKNSDTTHSYAPHIKFHSTQ